MERRHFLHRAGLVGAGFTILPSGFLRGQNAPSNKLNIALIGAHGRGLAHWDSLAGENLVALCDVHDGHLALALERFPKAKTYKDWRRCLDHPGLDAVVICTTDHTHAFIANWAMNRNLHVYCEKPLAITVEEARLVRAKWLTKRDKLATQVGMQRHALPNFNRVSELIRDGAIGDLKSVSAWGNRQIRRQGYFPAAGSPPAGFDYDLWLGPSPEHPYNPAYFAGKPGMNCLEWNMFWDFGCGQIGDMGSHTMDLVWNAIDAKVPTSISAKGETFNPDVTPVECESHFDHPANEWRGPIRVSWYQGGVMPRSPKPFIDLEKISHGAIFKGSRGFLIADFESRMIIPFGDDADLGYYKRRGKGELLPDVGPFQKQWFDACRDPGRSTACDFGYSADMIEQMLLGLVAYRVGAKIEYNSETGTITNHESANQYLRKSYRDGWSMEG